MDLEGLAQDFASLQESAKDVMARLEVLNKRADALKPGVLAHFNEWADRTLKPILKRDSVSLEDAQSALYDFARGKFTITMGRVLYNGMPADDYFNDEAFEAVGQYERETQWVLEVDTGFDIPK